MNDKEMHKRHFAVNQILGLHIEGTSYNPNPKDIARKRKKLEEEIKKAKTQDKGTQVK